MANLLEKRLEETDAETNKQKNKKQKVTKTKNSTKRIKPVKEKKVKTEPKPEKIKKKTAKEAVEDLGSSEEFEQEIEVISIDEVKIKADKKVKSRRQYLAVKIFLCICCGYLAFLIYGVMVTNYGYNDDGEIAPQIMSVEDVKKQKEFSVLLGYYMDARDLYEKVLVIDYRLGLGKEDPLDLAPEYEALLDTSSEIIVQLEALSVSTEYTQAYNLLLTWVQTDISVYLQNVSGAISQNNSDMASEAVLDKETAYTDFYQLTANMISLGSDIKGIDITDVKDWSPEDYIEEYTGK